MSKDITIAAAQTIPHSQDVERNLADHVGFIEHAAELGAGIIVFPELSITGYDLSGMPKDLFTLYDKRLRKILPLAKKLNIMVIAGGPFKIGADVYIGSFIISPESTITVYTKHHLHSGEDQYFKAGHCDPKIWIGDEQASLAVCADTGFPDHARKAAQSGSSYYLASVFFTEKGYNKDAARLGSYAEELNMVVVMSNYGGPSGGIPSAGRSAIWSTTGSVIASLPGPGAGLVLVTRKDDLWEGKAVRL